MEEAGFIVNPLKCTCAANSTEYLGFLLTADGLKPLLHKIMAMTLVVHPTSTKEVFSFVEMISYYKDMFPKRAQILVPLSELYSSMTKFKWTDVYKATFQ